MISKLVLVSALSYTALWLPATGWLTMPRVLANSPNVVISEVLPEGSNASQEFIELYNNSPGDVSLDGWSLQLRSANNGLNKTINLSNQLEGQGYALLASTNHLEACAAADYECFSATMSTNGGHILLIDGAGEVVDRLAWGSAVNPENIAAPIATASMSLTRRVTVSNAATLQDTDNNSVDFQATAPSPTGGGVYDPATAVDLCANLVGMQEEIPNGYEGSSYICQPIAVPEIEPVSTANCQGVALSEIVPNPAGVDTGREFIELHNQTSSPVDLTGCILKVGSSQQVLSGAIEPGYRAFYGLSLPNAAGGTVSFITNTITSDVDYPANLEDDESYSYIDGSWRRGAWPSPGAANQLPVLPDEAVDSAVSELTACPAGKYRHPETNRCRNVATTITDLAPCDPGETRNLETNRCRKHSSITSGPSSCPAGQQRSPETNRCRKVASAKTINPITSPAKATAKPVSYYVLAIVAGLAVVYGLYEYRHSLRNFITKRRRS